MRKEEFRDRWDGSSDGVKEQKSKLESDTISRQAVIDYLNRLLDGRFDAGKSAMIQGIRDNIRHLPPEEPPKKIVAQIKIDVEEIVERIKEEYEIKDRPVCEDAISRQDTVNALCAKCGDAYRNCRDYKAWCPNVKVVMSMPPVETKRLPQPHKCVVYRDGECRYPIEACSECPKHEGMRAVLAERPKGEWIFNPKDAIDSMFAKPKCNKCGFESADGGNFCPNCGAKMKGVDDEKR